MNINDFEIYAYESKNKEKKDCHILFAHANGIPALTYKSLFESLSQKLNVVIVTYDMRGIGRTKVKEYITKEIWSWQTLVDDHIFIFQHLNKTMPGNWIFAGHSLGAWVSLLASEKLGIHDVWLLDPPILMPSVVAKWLTAILIRKRHLIPNSKKVKKRKTTFPSYNAAYHYLKQSSLMKNWSEESIYNYLEGSFEQKENHIQLRHNPQWEGHLFEEYPPMAAMGFLKLSFTFRKQLRPVFFIGKKSDTCNPNSKAWVKLFFPKLQWILIENGRHMFPIENSESIIQHILELVVK